LEFVFRLFFFLRKRIVESVSCFFFFKETDCGIRFPFPFFNLGETDCGSRFPKRNQESVLAVFFGFQLSVKSVLASDLLLAFNVFYLNSFHVINLIVICLEFVKLNLHLELLFLREKKKGKMRASLFYLLICILFYYRYG